MNADPEVLLVHVPVPDAGTDIRRRAVEHEIKDALEKLERAAKRYKARAEQSGDLAWDVAAKEIQVLISPNLRRALTVIGKSTV